MNSSKKRKYRTLFISDVHLGTKISQDKSLLEFLKSIEVKRIYLVGDIIDVSAFRRKFFWNKHHNGVVRRLLKLVKNKVKIIYIPGNHDRELRDFDGMDFAGIKFRNRDIYTTAQKKRLLIVHGDEFDGILREQMRWLYTIGDYSYSVAIFLSRILKPVTALFGNGDFSLSMYLKTRVKNAIQFINDFEQLIAREAVSAKVDGVVCGHIHSPDLRIIENKIYANCGCWTETCSALVEHLDGSLEIIELNNGKRLPKNEDAKYGSQNN